MRKRKVVWLIVLVPFLFVLQGCFNQSPIASITCSPQGGAVPLTVAFSGDSSYDPDGDIVEYSWDFGDGGDANGITSTHTYSSVGCFEVTLTVTDAEGRRASRTVSVYAADVIPYDSLFRNNANYVGDTVLVEGEIIQVVEQLFGGFAWRVATGENQYFGYVGDVVYVNYDGPRFLDGDIVRVVAIVDGLKTYSSLIGQVTIPEVTAVTVELIQ